MSYFKILIWRRLCLGYQQKEFFIMMIVMKQAKMNTRTSCCYQNVKMDTKIYICYQESFCWKSPKYLCKHTKMTAAKITKMTRTKFLLTHVTFYFQFFWPFNGLWISDNHRKFTIRYESIKVVFWLLLLFVSFHLQRNFTNN